MNTRIYLYGDNDVYLGVYNLLNSKPPSIVEYRDRYYALNLWSIKSSENGFEADYDIAEVPTFIPYLEENK